MMNQYQWKKKIRIKSSSVFVSEKSNLCVKILYECLKAFDVSMKYIKIQKEKVCERRAKRKKKIRELESAKQEIL